MNILSADLNLLVALDALLQERNVTRAGARIGVSQSAMSSALSRLRRQFDDELLTRVGTRYELTPLAQVLTDRVAEVLRLIERTLSSQPTFQPATSTREFRVVGSDYALSLLTPYLMSMLKQQAPKVKLRLESVRPIAVDSPEELLRSVDLLLIPRGHFTGLPVKDLFQDRWVCITGADNDRADEPVHPGRRGGVALGPGVRSGQRDPGRPADRRHCRLRSTHRRRRGQLLHAPVCRVRDHPVRHGAGATGARVPVPLPVADR